MANGTEFERGCIAGKQAATLETIQDSLDRLELRLFGEDGTKGAIGAVHSRINETDHKVAKLERWRTFLMGAWAVLAGLFTIKHGG